MKITHDSKIPETVHVALKTRDQLIIIQSICSLSTTRGHNVSLEPENLVGNLDLNLLPQRTLIKTNYVHLLELQV